MAPRASVCHLRFRPCPAGGAARMMATFSLRVRRPDELPEVRVIGAGSVDHALKDPRRPPRRRPFPPGRPCRSRVAGHEPRIVRSPPPIAGRPVVAFLHAPEGVVRRGARRLHLGEPLPASALQGEALPGLAPTALVSAFSLRSESSIVAIAFAGSRPSAGALRNWLTALRTLRLASCSTALTLKAAFSLFMAAA